MTDKRTEGPIVVTMGEPAGIGPELLIMAWQKRKKLGLPAYYVRSDIQLLRQRAKRLDLRLEIEDIKPGEAKKAFAHALPVVQTGPALADTPGVENPEAAQSVVDCIRLGVEDVYKGDASALVTNPINKSALYKTGFSFPGHTEFLGELAHTHWPGRRSRPVMMIAGPELMVVPVTIHIALNKVSETLSKELLVEIAETTAADLKSKFGIKTPRLAICGLNPHAGENGTMGTEEQTTIEPAIEELRSKGIDATGPHPADTLFHPPARKTYDCVLGMYHDQVLVPAKTIGFDDSVNVTLGLPFVRTSPDHGTAYNIAGTGRAKIDSFAAAMRMAHALGNPSTI